MKINGSIIVGVFLLSFFFGCGQKERTVNPAFYHWQTVFDLTEMEQTYLAKIKTRKIYVKFFDLDWDAKRGEAIPLASLISNQKQSDEMELVPVVFITNRTLSYLSEKEIPALSKKIDKKIKTIWNTVSNRDIHEVQFDCDWTKTTKEKYFSLLKHFRKENKNVILSSTIRLHQIKFAKKTGIPPVDRGMLMFYNMADVDNIQTVNSILDIEIAKQYIKPKMNYSLPLDMALPIFRWGILFRDGKLIKLINNLEQVDLQDASRFKAISKNKYQVLKSTYLKGYYLYGNDILRLEFVPPADLIKSAQLLRNCFYNNETTVVFYHLDTRTIKHYTYEKIQNVLQVFEE